MTFEINTSQGPAVQSPYGAILLGDLLNIDIDTGDLFFKKRPVFWFASERTGKMWNTRFAGKKCESSSLGYVVVRLFSIHMKGHRIAFAMANGYWPVGLIDHGNRIRSDNRPVNLAQATPKENCRNRKLYCTNSSGHAGVTWNKKLGLWAASISDGERIHIGYFPAIEQAIAARKKAELDYGYHRNHGV